LTESERAREREMEKAKENEIENFRVHAGDIVGETKRERVRRESMQSLPDYARELRAQMPIEGVYVSRGVCGVCDPCDLCALCANSESQC